MICAFSMTTSWPAMYKFRISILGNILAASNTKDRLKDMVYMMIIINRDKSCSKPPHHPITNPHLDQDDPGVTSFFFHLKVGFNNRMQKHSKKRHL